MGGTSTDVAHYAGEFERAFETQVAGVRMRAPMMSIHTVAAGGGSILGFDGARLRVGPQSAGAEPGAGVLPARRPADRHRRQRDARQDPAGVLPEGVRPARRRAARRATSSRAKFAALAAEIARATGAPRTPEEVAEGFIDIAVGSMANAIKKISVARGYDVTRYTLQCFGGAGGQHACRVADALGMRRVFVHPLAGVLSAYGMGLADQTRDARGGGRAAARRRALPDGRVRGSTRSPPRPRDELRAPGRGRRAVRVDAPRVHVRYEGTDSALVVPFGDRGRDPRRVRGRVPAALRVPDAGARAGRRGGVGRGGRRRRRAGRAAHRGRSRRRRAPDRRAPCAMFSGGRWRDAALVVRERRCARARHRRARRSSRRSNATTVVEPGWQARVTELDHLVLDRVASARAARARSARRVDPVMLEVFNNLFMNIAEQMGLQLQNTAYSVNIKERLDFSCALFDADGNLIANAPHMPVHLGSMSESIKTVIARNAGRDAPGDVYVLNDPYHGGTHLPDVTVVTPVFDADDDDILFYVGSRGHHADIGGVTPGLDAAVLDAHRGGGRADRQRQAGRARAAARGRDARAARAAARTRRATRSRTSPT